MFVVDVVAAASAEPAIEKSRTAHDAMAVGTDSTDRR